MGGRGKEGGVDHGWTREGGGSGPWVDAGGRGSGPWASYRHLIFSLGPVVGKWD